MVKTLELPKTCHSSRLVAAGHYVKGSDCPNCGNPGGAIYYEAEYLAHVVDQYATREAGLCPPYETEMHGRTVTLFYCFSVCKTDDVEHVTSDEDQCQGDSDHCTKHCTCDRCPGCAVKGCTDCSECSYCGEYNCDYLYGECVESDDDCDCEDCLSSRGSDGPCPFRPYYSGAQDGRELYAHWVDQWATIDVAGSMADFYLYHWMTVKTGQLSVGEFVDKERLAIAEDATGREIYESSVKHLDHAFRVYLAMAIGGEIRHYRNNDALSGSRKTAWCEFVGIAEAMRAKEVDPWETCSEIFRDRGWSTGFGGEAWAVISDILGMRERGQLRPDLFVDRVFSLQHNNGSVLNKASWGKTRVPYESSPDLCRIVGNAHAATETDVATLLFFATGQMRSIYARWARAYNKCRVASGLRVERLPQSDDNVTERDIWGRVSNWLMTADGEEISLAE